VFVHPQAINESPHVGNGTNIWAFAHVMPEARIGENCNIGDHAFIESGATVGNGVTVKNGVYIWEGITIEDYVFIGPGVVFTNDRHPRSPRAPAAGERYESKEWLLRTVVEEGASIGANATILPGLTIGRYSMIGAGATVTSDVPAHALVMGSPATVVRFVCKCGQPLQSDEITDCEACQERGT